MTSAARSALSSAPLLLLALGVLLLASFAAAQQIRIPIRAVDVPAGQHFRSSRAMAAHAARNFAGPMRNVNHAAQRLYLDSPSLVPLKNFYNRMYVGKIEVGTPAVSYSVVFDTGSADLWLFAAASQKPTLDYVQYYDPAKSSTSRVTTEDWSIQYGKGASEGKLVYDNVALAGKTATNFKFAQATTYSDDFESPDMPLDGLLGLAFSQVNSAKGPTLMDALQSQGLIRERVFSFYLTTENPVGSEFVIGSPDPSLMSQGSNITYHDLASTSGMWLLSMQAVKVGGATTSFCGNPDCAVLMDTGTSFIGMPTAAYNLFASRVASVRPDCLIDSRSGLMRCDRDTTEGLPSISFSIQGSLFELKGSDYYQSGVLGMMGIEIGSSGSPFWILGDTFLKTYYTVFDMDKKVIGIVGAKPGVPYTPPSSESSPLGSLTWQIVTICIAVLIGTICLVVCCVRACASPLRHNSPRASGMPLSGGHRLGGAPAPYVLQGGPTFAAAPYTAQPAAMRAGYVPQSDEGVAHPAYIPPRSGTLSPRRPLQAQAQSDFARDFYRQPERQ